MLVKITAIFWTRRRLPQELEEDWCESAFSPLLHYYRCDELVRVLLVEGGLEDDLPADVLTFEEYC